MNNTTFDSAILPHFINETLIIRPKNNALMLGEGLKGLVFIYKSATDETEFLEKILTALKLSIADALIINMYENSISWINIVEKLSVNTVILFEIDPKHIHLSIPIPNLYLINLGQTSFMQYGNIDFFKNNPEQKKHLFGFLKSKYPITE